MSTGKQKFVVSSANGEYRFVKLDIGAYSISAEIDGNEQVQEFVALERKNSIKQLDLAASPPDEADVVSSRRMLYLRLKGDGTAAVFNAAGPARQQKLFVEAVTEALVRQYEPGAGRSKSLSQPILVTLLRVAVSQVPGELGTVLQDQVTNRLMGDDPVKERLKKMQEQRTKLIQRTLEGRPAPTEPLEIAGAFVAAVKHQHAQQKSSITVMALYLSDMDRVYGGSTTRPGELHIQKMFGDAGLQAWKGRTIRERSLWLQARAEEMLVSAEHVLTSNNDEITAATIDSHAQLRETVKRVSRVGLVREALGETAAERMSKCEQEKGRCERLVSAATAIMLAWNALAAFEM